MSEEEAIDILKNSISDYVIGDYCSKCGDYTICEDRDEDCYYIKAIDTIINRVKELEEDNKYQWEERCKMAIELDNDVIPISKIKEKIEELEEGYTDEVGFDIDARYYNQFIVDCVEILEELLGEK